MSLAAMPFALSGLGDVALTIAGRKAPFPRSEKNKIGIHVFSKHLQWLSVPDMAALAARIGFDGIDLTVRPGGHVLPEKVNTDLPRAVEAIKKAGLRVDTITTAIGDTNEKYTDDILSTASRLGIKNYRMGWYNYNKQISIEANVAGFKVKLKKLAEMNARYDIHGDYENHTGMFGGPIWDLWEAMKGIDPEHLGVQYDILHATVDGGKAWPTNFDLIRDRIGSITIKDFIWAKKGAKWEPAKTPLGEGMIDFDQYFGLLKKHDMRVPLSLHFEYPMGGAENGDMKLTVPEKEVITTMQKDLHTLKTLLKKHDLI